ncbi:MAG TPA: hypothetical protein VF163_18195, partial [Micromonosporaceae bacterium]
SRMEADLGKLIESLTEWTKEMQAARPVVAEAPAPRRRSASRARKAVPKPTPTPLYPRGNPLTQSMTFTDRDGAVWLAYIEGAEPAPSRRRRKAVLPGRRLRFDGASESRFTTSVPAGCPFLAEPRLQALLDEARPEQPSTETVAAATAGDWVVEWPLRAAKSGQEVVADGYRKVLDLASEAAETMQGVANVVLGHRPARS